MADGTESKCRSVPIDTTFDVNISRFTTRFPCPSHSALVSSGKVGGAMDSLTETLLSLDKMTVSSSMDHQDATRARQVELVFDILLDGEVSMTTQNIFRGPLPERRGGSKSKDSQRGTEKSGEEDEDSDSELEKLERLARDLEVAGNLDTWVEWITHLASK
jgi:hypothetical protein